MSDNDEGDEEVKKEEPKAEVKHEATEEEEEPEAEKEKEKPKDELGPKDFDILREHIRVAKGMKLTDNVKRKAKFKLSSAPKIKIKENGAFTKRKKHMDELIKEKKKPPEEKLNELRQRAEDAKLKQVEEFKTNISHDFRWKTSRGQLILTDQMKETFKKYGKPPYITYTNRNCIRKDESGNKCGQKGEEKVGN